jgi:hypothetical protein
MEYMGSATATASGLEKKLRDVEVLAGGMAFHGSLRMPNCPRGLAIFVNGGSNLATPDVSGLASRLPSQGIATLLLDPCAVPIPSAAETVFDIEFLARRAVAACLWAKKHPATVGLRLALCGHGMGAAAALLAAASLHSAATAVVSVDGRPDLAAPALTRVKGSVLLLVRERERILLDLNRLALERLCGRARLEAISQRGRRSSDGSQERELTHLIGTWLQEQWAGSGAHSAAAHEARAERVGQFSSRNLAMALDT